MSNTCTLFEREESSDSPNTFCGGGGVSRGHLSAAQPSASMSSGGRLRGGSSSGDGASESAGRPEGQR